MAKVKNSWYNFLIRLLSSELSTVHGIREFDGPHLSTLHIEEDLVFYSLSKYEGKQIMKNTQ